MLRRSSLIACACVFLLAGCASQNPYDQRAPSSNRTATYGGLGALAGAAAVSLRAISSAAPNSACAVAASSCNSASVPSRTRGVAVPGTAAMASSLRLAR